MKKYLMLIFLISSVGVFSQIDKEKIFKTWYLKKSNWKTKTLKFSTNKLNFGTLLKFFSRDSIFEFYSAPCGSDSELWRTMKQGKSTFTIKNDTLFTNGIKVKNLGNKFLILALKEDELILKSIN